MAGDDAAWPELPESVAVFGACMMLATAWKLRLTGARALLDDWALTLGQTVDEVAQLVIDELDQPPVEKRLPS